MLSLLDQAALWVGWGVLTLFALASTLVFMAWIADIVIKRIGLFRDICAALSIVHQRRREKRGGK